MFDVGSSELLMIAIVAIVVIGPKDLPRALYKLGQIVGKARAMSRHFRTGIDAMVREVEMEEMQKQWAEQNRRIMEQYPDAEADEPKPVKSEQLPLFDGAAGQEHGAAVEGAVKPTPMPSEGPAA